MNCHVIAVHQELTPLAKYTPDSSLLKTDGNKSKDFLKFNSKMNCHAIEKVCRKLSNLRL